MNDGLNEALWGTNQELNPEIAQNLMDIAMDFVDTHVIPKEAIVDITLTGSLANYNWSEHSDIDLHIVLDFDQLDDDEELLAHYFRLAKSVWNSDHEIDICGHEVEVYVQNAAEPHHSTGIYSISNRSWVEMPQKDRGQPADPSTIDKKFADLSARIKDVEQKVQLKDNSALEAAQRLKEKIRKMRSSGLQSGGEYSAENLAFKKLRNQGYLGRLSDATKLAYDNQFTVDDCPA
jgi:hypothetical protein